MSPASKKALSILFSAAFTFAAAIDSGTTSTPTTLLTDGYDEKMGARPMQRLIQDKIKKNLAESILFGDLSKKGGVVLVSEKKDDLVISFELESSEEEVKADK